MKKIFLPIIGLGAILFAMTLNLNYAANDYGILENTLSFHVTAQASTSGNGGSDSGSGSNSGGGSNSSSEPGITCNGGGYGLCYKLNLVRDAVGIPLYYKCVANGDPKSTCTAADVYNENQRL